MNLKLITAPATLAVPLADAKAHCRVDASDEDAWITAAIKAATLAAEHHTGRRFITQTWEAVYDGFGSGSVELGAMPVQSIVSVKYLDAAGAEQTLSGGAYVLDADTVPGYVRPAAGATWPATYAAANAVRVRFLCGYGAAATDVPENARLWILMHVSTAYRHRESMAAGFSVTELVNRYHDALLDPLRLWRL
jgi:uncharacterized phiE125 gp8 family phage protein